ncbi:MAG: HAMP domain-containing protein, partial [Bdellovibrionales bacterium]|nr:HAMP domain-containing protein [Bdellovibrionales bacterium]
MPKRTKILSLGVLSLLAVLSVSIGVALYLQQEMPDIEAERTLTSNLGFFLLINLNIIVVMVLGFLVVKNLVKLVLDRRKNILGARLRSRLVVAFVGLSMIPTVLLFLIAKGMLERGLQEWFSPQIVSSVDGALGVARYHYESTEAAVYRYTRRLTQGLEELYPHVASAAGVNDAAFAQPEAQRLIEHYLETKREELGLFDLSLVDQHGKVIAGSSSLEARRNLVTLPGPNLTLVRRALLNGEAVVNPEQSIDGEFLRGYAPLHYSLEHSLTGSLPYRRQGQSFSSEPQAAPPVLAPPRHVLIATHWVLPELARALGTVINAYDDYKELKSYRRPIASSYILTLVVVTLLIVFGAVWVGFYLARDLSVPIGLLAEGTEQVAHGNLDHQIPEVGDDELSVLVRSFNTMTADLKM